MIIDIEVKYDRVSLSENPLDTKIVSGSKNYYILSAYFQTDDWDGLNRAAVIRANSGAWYGVEMVEGGDPQLYTAVIPEAIVAEAGYMDIGILGKDGDELRITTDILRIKILPGVSEGNSVPPLPDAGWEKYLAQKVDDVLEGIDWKAHIDEIFPISTDDIADGAVTEAKLDTEAVSTNHLQDGSVSSRKIADGAVSELKISNSAVTEEKLCDEAVTENKLGPMAVTSGKIDTGAVTEAKLGPEVKDKLTSLQKNSHTHLNKSTLDSITSAKVSGWDNALTSAKEYTDEQVREAKASVHTHANKDILDNVTNAVVQNCHEHDNRDLLDAITTPRVSGWDSAAASSHTHPNMAALEHISLECIEKWNSGGYEGELESVDALWALMNKNQWKAGQMWLATGKIEFASISYAEEGDFLVAVEGHPEKADSYPPNTVRKYFRRVAGGSSLEAVKAAAQSADNAAGLARSSAETAKDSAEAANRSLGGLTADVTSLEARMSEVEKNPGKDYDATYEDETFTLLEDGEPKAQFKITGGGGGGTSTTVKIERITDESTAVLSTDESAIIEFNFSSVDSSGDTTGNGTATWTVGNTVVDTNISVVQGENSYNIRKYLKNGANTVKLRITDSEGAMASKTWTVTVVDFRVESTFDDNTFYSGDVLFAYTPYGDISKEVIFELDGSQISSVTTSVTGRQQTLSITARDHGAHLLKVYMKGRVNGLDVQSAPLYKDIIWVDPEETTPIIGCRTQSFTATQYNTTPIEYIVYDPQNRETSVTLKEGEDTVAELSGIGRTAQTWAYRCTTFGQKTLSITCGDVTKQIVATIAELDLDVEPVTTGLAFDFNPSGKTNAAADWLKINDNLTMTVSDDFDKTNGGYQIDADGDTYFCVKAGTSAVIPYTAFNKDAKAHGKEIKIIFKTTNVRNYDATAMTCVGSDGIGLTVSAQQAVLKSQTNDLTVPYCEDNFIELEFNILPDSQHPEMVAFVDAIPSRVKLYGTGEADSFVQAQPVGITIGSEDCDVWIYRMKVYETSLSDDEILDNFICDAKNANEMIARYTRNDILDASGSLDPDTLAEKCPDLRIIKISAPVFTQGKKYEVADTTVQMIYKNGRAKEDNWTAAGTHKGQGTSSEHYGDSARNIDINLKGGFTFGDGSQGEKYAMTENSIPEKYFNIKLNVASSENCNNSRLSDWYNTYNPYKRQARLVDPRVRDTMEFHPCVVFIQETDTDNAVVYNDGQWHFYGCGDFGNSKKNNDAMGMDPENAKECIVENLNNGSEQGRFLSDDLTQEKWDGDGAFEFRYVRDEDNADEVKACQDSWQKFLTWVVNVRSENFLAEAPRHLALESALFHYIFTERFCMTDNRAKNTFWHTSDGERWDICFAYDHDTAMGNDNEGGLTLTYGLEDTDQINGAWVYNAHDSRLWQLIRENCYDQLAEMYRNLEQQNAFTAEVIRRMCEDYQDVKPERLWMADMRRKYFRPYEENGTTTYLPMMHGNKRHQRRQFNVYQEKYISSKYIGPVASADVITMRGESGTAGDYDIVPYADTYIVTRFGNLMSRVRGKRGQTYKIPNPGYDLSDTEMYVYNASLIQSIGDVSDFYPSYANFNYAVKLTDLQIGSGDEEYSNAAMTEFGIGNNILLEHLDLQNLPGLAQSIDLTGCINLETFLAEGSGITGVNFAPGGKIATAHLPGITALTCKNLLYLTDLTLEDYANLQSLTVENSPAVDTLDLVDKASGLNRARILGVNWTVAGQPEFDWNAESNKMEAILDRLAGMRGYDEQSHDTPNSVLTGQVYVPVLRQSKEALYKSIWGDGLTIEYGSYIQQYEVRFENWDGSLLYSCHIDRGGTPADPVLAGLIEAPVRPSSISTVYTYSGWNKTFDPVAGPVTYTAQYSESVRRYTVRWWAQTGVKLAERTADYGTEVVYEGELPTRTEEEAQLNFYLFKGWDKSTGFIKGDTDVYALWDFAALPEPGKDMSDMSAAEIYAVRQSGNAKNRFSLKDRAKITFGFDPQFTNLEHLDFVTGETKFDGKKYIDTGFKLFAEDTSWTLVTDVKFDDTTLNQTMLCCFEDEGFMGFKLRYNNGPSIQWGTNSYNSGAATYREIMVIRHIQGSRDVWIYSSNAYTDNIATQTLTKINDTKTSATLVLGAAKAANGQYGDFATGTLYSCRLWKGDLGDAVCRQLVCWPRETYLFEVAGFGRNRITGNSMQSTSIDFICASLLERPHRMDPSNDTAFPETEMYKWMDKRILTALPYEWRSMLKTCRVNYNVYVDGKSGNIQTMDARVWLPAYAEMTSTTAEPWVYEGTWIPFFVDNQSRKKYPGIAVPEDSVYYTDSTDPTDTAEVKEGDVWNNQIYHNGQWVASSYYWLRGHRVTNTGFCHISSFGEVNNPVNYYAYTAYGVCPCFSI